MAELEVANADLEALKGTLQSSTSFINEVVLEMDSEINTILTEVLIEGATHDKFFRLAKNLINDVQTNHFAFILEYNDLLTDFESKLKS